MLDTCGRGGVYSGVHDELDALDTRVAMRDRREDWSELEDLRTDNSDPGVPRGVIVRDLLIFQLKLFLDGFVDAALIPISIAAAALDFFFGGKRRGKALYGVLRLGERVDLWLNLYGASRSADADGLFGGSKAGSKTLLGELEMQLRGGDEPRRRRKKR